LRNCIDRFVHIVPICALYMASLQDLGLNEQKAKIVLHLSQYKTDYWLSKWDVPFELTQPKIAQAIGTVRSNATKYLHDLMADGLVKSDIKHILEYNGRKRNAYFLTLRGFEIAEKILEYSNELI